MRKLLIFIAVSVVAAFSLQSCKKDSYVAAFDKLPNERMNDTINFVRNTLTSAPYGWIAITPTKLAGGYGFYMRFDTANFVSMYSDLWTGQFAKDSIRSQYRVRGDLGVALSFDTYNSISEIYNPDNNVRDGYGGDIDYIYDHSTADSIIFLGKRYRQQLALVKATASQQSAYKSGGYLTAINALNTFFTNNAIPYFTLEDGSRIMIIPNFSRDLDNGKRITLIAQDTKGNVTAAKSKFAMTIDQMAFVDSGVNISNLKFVKIAWKDPQTLAIYSSTGKEYVINNAPSPFIQLYQLMGLKYSLFGGFKTIYPGTTTSGQTILNSYYNSLAAVPNGNGGNYVFNFGTLAFTWNLPNSRVTLTSFHSQNGGTSGWNTTIVYSYKVDANGNYTFTKQTAASGGYTAPILTTLDNFLLNNVVNLDYYTDAVTKIMYGQMASVGTPTTVMTFQLR